MPSSMVPARDRPDRRPKLTLDAVIGIAGTTVGAISLVGAIGNLAGPLGAVVGAVVGVIAGAGLALSDAYKRAKRRDEMR